MTEQEYLAIINSLKNEISNLKAELTEVRKENKAKIQKRLRLPQSVGEKYEGKTAHYGKATLRFPFLNNALVDELSHVIRGSLFPYERIETKPNKYGMGHRDIVKRVDKMTDEEYSEYLECMDSILAVLYGHYTKRRQT